MFLHIKLGHKEGAIECLEGYMEYCRSQQRPIRPYYVLMLDILRGTVVDTESRDYLIASSFLAHPNNALSAIDTPSCFNCDQCSLSIGCRFPLLKEIERICQKTMKNNIPKQDSLKELFDVYV